MKAANNMAQVPTLFDTTWAELSTMMARVFRLEPITKDNFLQLYNAVQNYFSSPEYQEVLMREGQEIQRTRAPAANAANPRNQEQPRPKIAGDQMYSQIETFLRNHVQHLAENEGNREGEQFLSFYADNWGTYQFLSKILNGIFNSMNNNWIQRQQRDGHRSIHKIFTLAMHVWKELFFEQSNQSLPDTCFNLILKERNGEHINALRIKNVVLSYVMIGSDAAQQTGVYQQSTALKIYKEFFESKFLEDTRQFYQKEVATLLSSGSHLDYMRKVKKRLEEEEHRVKSYLHETTAPSLYSLVEKVLIEDQLESFYSESKIYMRDENIEALRLTFGLVNRLPGKTAPIANDFEQHVEKEAMDAMNRVAETAFTDAKIYVNTILEVYNRFSEILVKAFCSDPVFLTAMDRSFSKFVNRNAVTQRAGGSKKSSELLAVYTDGILRGGERATDGLGVEGKLDQILIIFNYIEDKDVFQKFYGKQLAKRLLSQKSSIDDEELMITKLKEICGYEYASKLQRMFQDIRVSATLNEEYREHCRVQAGFRIRDFSVTVLASNSWPFKPSTPFELPVELRTDLNGFTGFYTGKHNGRKLEPYYPQSRCELKALYADRQYIFQVSVYQAALLLLFNDYNTCSVQTMFELTSIESKILLDTVISLLKSKVLVCSAISADHLKQDLKDTDIQMEYTIKLATGYRSNKIRNNLNTVVRSIEQRESEAVNRTVEDDRKMLIQAAIVRTMKARQTLAHNALIQEVIPQLTARFRPEIPQIKKCIEILIEKEYLERAEQNGYYSYLA